MRRFWLGASTFTRRKVPNTSSANCPTRKGTPPNSTDLAGTQGRVPETDFGCDKVSLTVAVLMTASNDNCSIVGLSFWTIGMDKRNLDRYKRVLLEKRSEISVARAEAESPVPAAGGGEGDQIDHANADAEAELQIHLHQTNLRLLRAIENALARIRDGTFGTCEACQNPISRARLEAVPWARLCRDCKDREHG